MRNAIVGSSDVGASLTACLNAAISSCVAGRGLRFASSAQIGIPSEVSALRSDLRSASRQISHASACPIASKTSVGLPLISRVKICDGRGWSGCRDGSRTDMKLLLKRKATPTNDQRFPRRGNCQISKSGGLFAQGSDPGGRGKAQGFTKIGDRTGSNILQTQQVIVGRLTHFADRFHSRSIQCVPDPSGKSNLLDERNVRKLWRRIEHRPRDSFPQKTFIP